MYIVSYYCNFCQIKICILCFFRLKYISRFCLSLKQNSLKTPFTAMLKFKNLSGSTTIFYYLIKGAKRGQRIERL